MMEVYVYIPVHSVVHFKKFPHNKLYYFIAENQSNLHMKKENASLIHEM